MLELIHFHGLSAVDFGQVTLVLKVDAGVFIKLGQTSEELGLGVDLELPIQLAQVFEA